MARNTSEYNAQQSETDFAEVPDNDNNLTTQYDPKKLTEPGTDHTQGNNVIIAAYRDISFKPETEPRKFMHIGTGGHSIWERHWHKIALPDAPDYIGQAAFDMQRKGLEQEGPVRAMTFTAELASQYNGAQQYDLQAYRHTEVGLRQREQFEDRMTYILTQDDDDKLDTEMTNKEIAGLISAMRKSENSDQVTSKISDYVEQYPETWESRYNAIAEFSKDAFELGTHITFLGILEGDEEAIAVGRRIIDHASNKLDELLDDEDQTNDLIKSTGPDRMAMQWPYPGMNAEVLAEYRLAAMQETIKAFFNDPSEVSDEAVRFLAHTFVSHDRIAAEEQTSSYLHDLGTKDGGIPAALRLISDDIFEKPDHPITDQAVQAICNYDPAEIRDSYHKMGTVQTAIVAAAYVNDGHTSSTPNDIPYAIPDHYLDDLRKEITALAEQRSDSDNNHLRRNAEDLRTLAEPGYLEKCLIAAQASPQWQPFLNQEIAFRPYG